MAPELLLNLKYDEKVDVYSYGLIVYEIITGEIPFKDLTFEKIIMDVGRGGKRPKIPSTIPAPLQQLIQQVKSLVGKSTNN
jgi:serine/threonine protein kinase